MRQARAREGTGQEVRGNMPSLYDARRPAQARLVPEGKPSPGMKQVERIGAPGSSES